VSTDKEFAPKAAEVVGLYLNPPVNAVVLSVEENPSLQALERPGGYIETDSGAVVRALKSTYKRHGTLNLFAALEVGTGQVRTQFTDSKRRAPAIARRQAHTHSPRVRHHMPVGQNVPISTENYP
jgi:hypothetical protein